MSNEWELLAGPAAEVREVENFQRAADWTRGKLKLARKVLGHTVAGIAEPPGSADAIELHRVITSGLLHEPGQYRLAHVQVQTASGVVVHDPPREIHVPILMAAMDRELRSMWAEATMASVAAYTLWRVNWIHPFKNGNGRTARALAYQAACYKFGRMLGGTRTLPDLITENQRDYYEVLAIASESVKAGRSPDLGPAEEFVRDLLIQELNSRPLKRTSHPREESGRPSVNHTSSH